MKSNAMSLLFFCLVCLAGNLQLAAQIEKGVRGQSNAGNPKQVADFSGKALVLYVNANTSTTGDGTLQHPFKTISEAIQAAARVNKQPVINIAPGTYNENVQIINHSTLKGMTTNGGRELSGNCIIRGTVSMNGAFGLEMTDLNFKDAPVPGALVVNNPNAATILRNIRIDGAGRYGIYQNGGRAQFDSVTVTGTQPGPIAPADKITHNSEIGFYGTGISLYNVNAEIGHLQTKANTKALFVSGGNVIVKEMVASQHRVNAALRESLVCGSNPFSNGLGCIEAANGARVQLRSCSITDNEFCGLSVRDGASVTCYDIIILRTKKSVCGNGESGGISVSARAGASLELDQFELGNTVIGLQIAGATAKCLNGRIHDNIIGAYVKDPAPAFNIADIQQNVMFQNNERNLDTQLVPLPPVKSN